jgi:hypothetical protein
MTESHQILSYPSRELAAKANQADSSGDLWCGLAAFYALCSCPFMQHELFYSLPGSMMLGSIKLNAPLPGPLGSCIRSGLQSCEATVVVCWGVSQRV